MSALLVVMVVTVLMTVEVGFAQQSNSNTNLGFECGSNQAMSPATFSGNLNSTFSQLRRKLSNNGVYYATAQSLGNDDAVYGLAQCRNYLSTAQCLACFDVAVSTVDPTCGSSNGVHVFLDNCFLRFENYNQYYSAPHGSTDFTTGICGNQTTSQPTTAFKQAVKELLSDIRVATPRTSDFYTASTRQVTSGNATIYAIGQCVENITKEICKNCIDSSYNDLSRCPPFNQGRAVDLACFMRYSEFPFFQANQTVNLIPFLAQGSSSKTGLIVGLSSGACFLFLILSFSLWYRRSKKSLSVGDQDTSNLQGGKNYSYQDVKMATNNFSAEYLVGKGGFGEVFKAIVDDGDVVAVKRLLHVGVRGRKEFANELKLISNVRHRNLILQLGWSIDGPEPLLVLEYLPQGSLDKFLWGESRGMLTWKQRSDIIFGIARGLAHLHEEFHVKIVHRDIKSSNILLDNQFQPKIADFGLARYHPDDQSHVSTRFAGTMGYTAPEYVTRGHLSERVDTYSFGIVTLEIISGRRCSDVYYSGPHMEYLLDQAWKLYEKGIHYELADEALDPNDYEKENLMKMVEIALMCTQSPASLRPTMSQVVLMLSSGTVSGQRQMSRPTFIGADRRIHIGDK